LGQKNETAKKDEGNLVFETAKKFSKISIISIGNHKISGKFGQGWFYIDKFFLLNILVLQFDPPT
jgi:hypothetical protein